MIFLFFNYRNKSLNQLTQFAIYEQIKCLVATQPPDRRQRRFYHKPVKNTVIKKIKSNNE